jgi:hypothetical protein
MEASFSCKGKTSISGFEIRGFGSRVGPYYRKKQYNLPTADPIPLTAEAFVKACQHSGLE